MPVQQNGILQPRVDVRIRLTEAAFAAIENWRRSQERIPCRSEAVRQLVEEALGRTPHHCARKSAVSGGTIMTPAISPTTP
jgi:hypothetical protein